MNIQQSLTVTPAVAIDDQRLMVSDLRCAYGKVEVLKGVSLTARPHEVIAVLGASGSGKSTFLRCINYLESPTAGRISLVGEEIRVRHRPDGRQVPADSHQIRRLRAKMAMVFQNFNLWSHMTVLENVIEAPIHVQRVPRSQAVEAAEALLEQVGIYAFRFSYPERLSGGQQQRAAIARALATEPEVMLFDEPTSSLDPELVTEVLAIMRKLAADGRTMIIVTHELGFAREVSNRVVFFHDGRIEEEGLPGEVMARPSSPLLRRFLSSGRS